MLLIGARARGRELRMRDATSPADNSNRGGIALAFAANNLAPMVASADAGTDSQACATK